MALSDNLQGWWCPSLDTSGNGSSVANELAGSGNNCNLTNVTWVADTSSGGVRALQFDGTAYSVTQSRIFTSGNPTELTIAFWQYLNPSPTFPVVPWSWDTAAWASTWNSDNNNFYSPRPAGRLATSTATEEWHQFAWSDNGTTCDYYVDGVKIGTHTGGSSPNVLNRRLWWGAYRPNLWLLSGRLDQMAVWDRVWSAADATAFYNGGRSLNLLATGSSNIAHVLRSIQQQHESVVTL